MWLAVRLTLIQQAGSSLSSHHRGHTGVDAPEHLIMASDENKRGDKLKTISLDNLPRLSTSWK